MGKKKTNKNCIGCSNEYSSYTSSGRKFCSRLCWSKNATITKPSTVFKKGQASFNYKGGKPKCVDCDKTLSTYNVSRCRSCDLSFRWKKGIYVMPSGKNSPLWKGGKTKENKLLRRKFQAHIAPLVLERDGYTCKSCGVRGVELHVDHVKSWSDFPELRFNMNNCVTLCRDCHYEKTFGRSIPDSVSSWGRNLQYIERGVSL